MAEDEAPAPAPETGSGRETPVLAALRFGGAALLAGVGGVHLDLYLTGYRDVHTVGPLFLVQTIASFVLAAAVVASRRWWVAVAGALFGVGTLAAYEVFRATTVFGFHEVRTTAGFTAGVLEALAFVALGGYAFLLRELGGMPTARRARAPLDQPIGTVPARVAGAWAVAAVALVVVVGVTAVPGRHGGGAAGGNGPTPGIVVVIQGFNYHPDHFTVRPGETVEVVNKDAVTHTLTARPGSAPLGHFDTGDIPPGGSATFTAPAAAGAYLFYCTVHTYMLGVLTVS